MEAPASASGNRCSWCGTLNSATVNVCSKCGAALASIQHQVVDTDPPAESVNQIVPEQDRALYQDDIRALVDPSLFDQITGEAMRSLGMRATFRSAQNWAFLTAGCLSLYILISLVGAVVDISRIQPSTTPSGGLRIPTAAVTASDVLTLLVGLALTAVALLTAVCFLAWIYRAYENLRALGATDLKYSSGWAIGGFFVPVLNLVRPFQVVTEIWKASAPRSGRSGEASWKYETTPPFIGLWWGSWLISGFLQSLGVFVVFGAGGANLVSVTSRLTLVYHVVGMVCAALAITVVLKINSRQENTDRLNSAAEARTWAEAENERHQL